LCRRFKPGPRYHFHRFFPAIRTKEVILPDTDFSSFTALVVDDNDFIRETVKQSLGLFGFKRVHLATNGMEALELLQLNPDIIICDINMEPLNGLQLARHVRNLKPPAGRVPIIFLTGDAQENRVQEAIDLAINAYLLKPVSQESLKKKLSALLLRKAG
jgi:two-component system chemotaxis response regulator CheY